jgi:hypothetical protein
MSKKTRVTQPPSTAIGKDIAVRVASKIPDTRAGITDPAQRRNRKGARPTNPAATSKIERDTASLVRALMTSATTRHSRALAPKRSRPASAKSTNSIPARFRKLRLHPIALELLAALYRAQQRDEYGSPMSVQELAALTGCDELEAALFLNELVTQGFVTEHRRFLVWRRFELAV